MKMAERKRAVENEMTIKVRMIIEKGIESIDIG